MTGKKRKKRGVKRVPMRDLEGEESRAEAAKKPDEADPSDSPAEGVHETASAEDVSADERAEVVEESEEVQEGEETDLAEQLAAMTENWQRERASFQNYKHRVEQEKREIRKYACWDLALDILRVLDYFESSISFSENLPDEAQSVINGVKYTVDELRRVLAAHGVSPIEVDEGEPFDSECMEAVERRERDNVAAGTVLEVQRGGWRLHDRVLRFAQVVVAVSPDGEEYRTFSEGGESEARERG
jgi:molecular chaperone GrpE